MTSTTHLAASLVAFAALASTSVLSVAQVPGKEGELDLRPKVGFGAPIKCVAGASGSVFAAAEAMHVVVDPASESWVGNEMKRVGFGAELPKESAAHSAAMRVSTLLKRGNIVAAMMANEEASRTHPAYKSSQFAPNFESLLTILTQPVLHASYPSSVRAEGEESARPGPHSHGVDMERTSASLLEVIRRAQMSKSALGKSYETPAVRYYVLGTGFRDAIALRAATGAVCALGLSESVLAKLDVSARFMAMPAAVSAAPVASGAKS